MAVYQCKNLFQNFTRRFSSFSSISDVLNKGKTEEKQCVQGWVKTCRKMKDVVFVDIDDGSSAKTLQIVIQKQNRPESLTFGSSIKAYGPITKNQNGQLEMHTEDVTVIGPTDSKKFPFSAKQNHSDDYCRQYLHLRPKLPHFKALLRVRHESMRAVHDWFHNNNFFSIFTPILTSNDCEGAGEVFQVLPVNQKLIYEMKRGKKDNEAFFGNSAFLSVSGQLHLEAVSRGMTKVYSFSPTFRAENSKSRLHLSEFYMVEAEESFVDNLDSVLNTIESFVKNIIGNILEKCREDLEVILKHSEEDFLKHFERIGKIVEMDFVRLSYDDAVKIINEKGGFKTDTKEGLTKEHELFLVEHFGRPVFVINWPKIQKPFYMKTCTDNDELVSAVDLLVPNVGELCGGSLREDDIDILRGKLEACGLTESMKWYLELREFGNVPTGGFGMGFERYLQLVTGLTNIKDTIPFPRWPHSLKM